MERIAHCSLLSAVKVNSIVGFWPKELKKSPNARIESKVFVFISLVFKMNIKVGFI
jgi:hypothetical protein